MSSTTSAGRSHCQNCGEALHGPYCAACGQHDVDYHRSLWPILEDSLEGFLHVDGKFFRTVRLLFTRPGFLTQEFNAGRRAAYTQPLRLYIFASLLFFASSFFFTHSPTQVEVRQTSAATPPAAQQVQAAAPSVIGRMVERIEHVDRKELARELEHLFPTMGFFCLPLLAALILLAYAGSGRVYVEHFIFAVHLQTFYFLAALLMEFTQALAQRVYAPLSGIVNFVFLLTGVWLVYRTFRAVYRQGRWRTILKMAFIGISYAIILLAGILVTTFAAALLVLDG
jgi:hypothetical protein